MAHLLSDVAGFKVDNASGSITDISGSVNSVSLDGGNASVQDTGLGDTRHTEINDIKPIMTISVNGMLNTTTRAIFAPIAKGTSVAKSVEVKLLSGQFLSGESRVGSVSFSVPVGLQTWSCEFRSADSTGFQATTVALA